MIPARAGSCGAAMDSVSARVGSCNLVVAPPLSTRWQSALLSAGVCGG